MHGTAPQLSLFPPDDEEEGICAANSAALRAGDPGFSIRRSKRARRLSIKVYPRGNVEVVVPRRMSAADVATFVAENQAWIRKTRAAFAEEHVPEPFRLPDVIELPAIEKIYTVRYVPVDGQPTVHYRLKGSCIVLSGCIGDEAQCVKAIRRALSSIAKRHFEPRLLALSELTALPYSRMHIRAQRTCWGSRSSSGTLSLNLCLLFVRPELLRYLMIHELSHGRHMNHSKRFWALVRRFEPDCRRLDRELGESWKAVPTWVGIY